MTEKRKTPVGNEEEYIGVVQPSRYAGYLKPYPQSYKQGTDANFNHLVPNAASLSNMCDSLNKTVLLRRRNKTSNHTKTSNVHRHLGSFPDLVNSHLLCHAF